MVAPCDIAMTPGDPHCEPLVISVRPHCDPSEAQLFETR